MKFAILALCIVAAMSDPHWLIMPEDEVTAVRAGWNAIKMDEVDILYSVFKAYPDIQARFPKFVNKDLDTLKDTASFALHATRIVGLFSEFIALLGPEGNQPAIKTILNEMGQNHRNRGISKELFNEFRAGLTAYVKGHSAWNDNASKSWDDAFDKMYYVIFSALDGKPVQ